MSRLATARFREFVVTLRDEEAARYAGLGMTAETVLEAETPVGECDEDTGSADLVVWETNQVVAVIRLRVGRMAEVRRFKN